MYGLHGLKASELEAELKALREKHGDLIVVGTDGEYGYPQGVTGVSYKKKDEREHYDVDCFRL